MSIFTNIILVIISVLLFCLIITLHEFGHYIMAKLSGIKVNEFAIGMGPVLYKKKKGDTQYSIRALPIGGYCAMEGEDEESSDANSFGSKPVWKRMLVVAMGAIFNILLGFVLIIIVNCGVKEFGTTTISKLNIPSQTSNLQEGDKILSINGYRVHTIKDFVFFASQTADLESDLKDESNVKSGVKARVEVERKNQKIEFDSIVLLKNKQNAQNAQSNKQPFRRAFDVVTKSNNFFSLINQSFWDVISDVRVVWFSLGALVTGKVSFTKVSGPIGIASAMTEGAAKVLAEGGLGSALLSIIGMLALITVNLGVVNLLPLPALDGGRLVFLFIELITKKRVPAKYERWIHAAGIILLLLLMLIISVGDVSKLFTKSGS